MILREKDKQLIVDLVKENISQPVKLWAFGSRVNGDAHDTSDLDLVLISEDKKIGKRLKKSIIFDGRNQYDKSRLES